MEMAPGARPVPRTAPEGLVPTVRKTTGPRFLPARRWLQPLLAVALLVALLAVPAAPSAAGTADDEAAFVAMINGLRQSRGLNALSVDPELTAQARRWSDVMAADDQLKHAGDLSTGITSSWDMLGENVGVHTVHDLDALFQAFVASPGHLENLLDPRFEQVGVGVTITAAGKVWTAHRFMSVTAPAAAVAPPPAPTPTAAPAPPATAPPTTAAPATAAPATPSPAPAPTPIAPPPAPTPRPTAAPPVPPAAATPGPASPAPAPAPADTTSRADPAPASDPTVPGPVAPGPRPGNAADGDPHEAGPTPGDPPAGAGPRPLGDSPTDRRQLEQVLVELAAVGF